MSPPTRRLKPITTLNTAVGAIPGALPPVIGWAAATGTVGIEAFGLFLIVFLWQFPHFLAIAWVHREDYARGGHKMLPCVDPDGRPDRPAGGGLCPGPGAGGPAADGRRAWRAGCTSPGRSSPACTTWPPRSGSGPIVNDPTARRLMRASFLYLPLILLLLLLNPMPA